MARIRANNASGGGGGGAFCLFMNWGTYNGFLFFSDGVNAPTRIAYPYSGTFSFDNDYVTFNKPSASASRSDSITYKKPASVYSSVFASGSSMASLFNGTPVAKNAGTIDTNMSSAQGDGFFSLCLLILFE